MSLVKISLMLNVNRIRMEVNYISKYIKEIVRKIRLIQPTP